MARRLLTLALLLGLAATPALAQQRITVGEMLARIDRLEREVSRLRVGGAGVPAAEATARLDQIEAELRRLTGLVERLQFELRSAKGGDDGLAALEARVEALENRPAAAPRPPVADTFAAAPLSPAPLPGPQERDEGFVGDGGAFAPPPPPPPPGPDVSGRSASELYADGIGLLNRGSFEEAGARFEGLVATYPNDALAGQAQYWLGTMHLRLGRLDEAAAAFLSAFRGWPEGPKAPDSLLSLGQTLAELGKRDEACLSFSQVPVRYPGASPTILRRAEIETQRNGCGG